MDARLQPEGEVGSLQSSVGSKSKNLSYTAAERSFFALVF